MSLLDDLEAEGLIGREPEDPCPTCRGEGAVGTGLSASFVDTSDVMPCPTCDGTGERET